MILQDCNYLKRGPEKVHTKKPALPFQSHRWSNHDHSYEWSVLNKKQSPLVNGLVPIFPSSIPYTLSLFILLLQPLHAFSSIMLTVKIRARFELEGTLTDHSVHCTTNNSVLRNALLTDDVLCMPAERLALHCGFGPETEVVPRLQKLLLVKDSLLCTSRRGAVKGRDVAWQTKLGHQAQISRCFRLALMSWLFYLAGKYCC